MENERNITVKVGPAVKAGNHNTPIADWRRCSACITGVNPCQNFTCWEGEQCAVNRLGLAECRCPESNGCDTSVRPVCGTDGQTYESKCHLERAGCDKRSAVAVAYHGHCGECTDGGVRRNAGKWARTNHVGNTWRTLRYLRILTVRRDAWPYGPYRGGGPW